MKIRNKIHPLDLDPYVGFIDSQKDLNKAPSIYERGIVGYIATVLFVLIDFVCLYTVWNIVQTESSILVRLLALGSAVCLDVPMAIAGVSLKKYFQKLMKKKTMLIIVVSSVATFLITFAFSLWFRMETKDLTFEINGSGMMNTISQTVQSDRDSKAVWVAAVFNGVIPLCTSIASFVITFFGSNPLNVKIFKLKEARIRLDSRMTDIMRALAEAERVEQYKCYLIAREKDLYEQFCDESTSIGELRKQATGIALDERFNDTDDITIVTQSREKALPEEENREPFDRAANVVIGSKKEDDVV